MKEATLISDLEGATALKGPAKGAWLALVYGVGLLPAVVLVSYTRSFARDAFLEYIENPAPMARWVGHGATAVIFALGGTALLVGIAMRGSREGLGLWLGSLALAVGPVLSSFLGLSPRLPTGHLAAPMLFTAAYLLPAPSVAWFLMHVRRILLFYIYGSLFAALIAPGWALEIPYSQGYIPIINLRLHGIIAQANQLAPIAWLYLMLNFHRTSGSGLPEERAGRAWVRRLNLIGAAVVLLLTQSKTTWALVVLGYSSYLFIRLLNRGAHSSIGLVAILLGVTGAIAFSVASSGWLDIPSAEALADDPLMTLTGRVGIWEVTLQILRENPWFGYGPHLWDYEMGLRYAPALGWAPTHAHSQYIQSLGESGWLGLVGLLGYGVVLLLHGYKGAHSNSGLTVILPIGWFARGISEAWYRSATSDGNLFMHFVIFATVLLALRDSWKRSMTKTGIPHGGPVSLRFQDRTMPSSPG